MLEVFQYNGGGKRISPSEIDGNKLVRVGMKDTHA